MNSARCAREAEAQDILKRFIIYRDPSAIGFSFWHFSVFVIAQTAVWLVLNYFIWKAIRPDVLASQLSAPWYAYVGWFALIHLLLGLFEYFFHRYVLHSAFWSLLRPMKRKHTEHHSHTHVRELANTEDTEGRLRVRNKYPIISPEQIESSAFPAYALLSFWLLFSLALIPTQLWFVNAPLLLSGYIAVTASFALYEIKHAVEHLDYDKHWKERVERSRFFRTWYAFHLMHHSRIRVNQAIGGVFALPVWDWVFRTYFIPKELPLPGSRVSPDSQSPPKPVALLRWLDRVVANAEARLVNRDKARAIRRSAR